MDTTSGCIRIPAARTALARLVLVLLFASLLGALGAQTNKEEYGLLKSYILPEKAMPASELQVVSDTYLKDNEPFSGIAFERFENGRLSRVVSLFRGKQHGPMYLWYPDGAPQMSANYRNGKLHGRFLGWYRNGGIIYDMAINQDGYAGDYLDTDEALLDDAGPENEGDAGDLNESD
jgi:antitoxin component YwqK of YwqJK toxin-antitoxin module